MVVLPPDPVRALDSLLAETFLRDTGQRFDPARVKLVSGQVHPAIEEW